MEFYETTHYDVKPTDPKVIFADDDDDEDEWYIPEISSSARRHGAIIRSPLPHFGNINCKARLAAGLSVVQHLSVRVVDVNPRLSIVYFVGCGGKGASVFLGQVNPMPPYDSVELLPPPIGGYLVFVMGKVAGHILPENDHWVSFAPWSYQPVGWHPSLEAAVDALIASGVQSGS